ncbi:MAG: glycosyl hydrolase [Ignavibacteria bacterium]|nr:glycosyl hydrolase [Ignavibacteria bacterium]
MNNFFKIVVSATSIFFMSQCIILAQSQKNLDALLELNKNPNPTFFDIKKAYEGYWDNPDGTQARGFKQYKRWEYFWEKRVTSDGKFPDALKIYNETQKFLNSKKPKNQLLASTWTSIGPSIRPKNNAGKATDGLGRINIVRLDPSNENNIWIGSAGGGVWKSLDGGTSWQKFPFTNFLSIGISDIAISPTNPNIVYVATGDADGANASPPSPFSIGIVKTVDGGDTWTITNLAYELANGKKIGRILVHPTNPNLVLATTNDGIYKTTNGGNSWTGAVKGINFIDMEFAPGNPDIVYASTRGWSSQSSIYKSENSGDSWALIKSISDCNRIAIAVTPVGPNNIYALGANQSGAFQSFLYSDDKGKTWNETSSSSNMVNILGWQDGTGNDANRGQGWYDLALAVSPYDEGKIFIGGINIWMSGDVGSTWKMVAHWTGYYNKPFVHADHHDLVFTSNKEVLFSANDGGLYKSTDQGNSWKDLTDGLAITQFYSISVSQQDPNVIISGAQDNGTSMLRSGTWMNAAGGDGMDCAINPKDPKNVYASQYNGSFVRSVDGGVSFFSMINKNTTGEDGRWVSPIALDPQNPSTIYVGYTYPWKSTDKGGSWKRISTFPVYSKIQFIAVAPNDANTIYCAVYNRVYATYNGGTTWASLSAPTDNVSSIAVDPLNPKRIWVTNDGYKAGSKVYEYNGTTWLPLSGNLPNVAVNFIVYQKYSPDRLYIGTDIGVYYSDYSSGYWELYGSGLPNVIVTELDIHYGAKKIRAATFGNGIWEAPINECNLPEPEVQVTGNTSFCEGDSVILSSKIEFPGYLWSNGEVSKQIVIKKSGSYNIIVQDGKGCNAKSNSVKVTVFTYPQMLITPGGNYPLCEGDSVINISLTAGLGFSQYKWSSGESDRKITVKQPGTYSVTGTTKDGCVSNSETFVLKYLTKPTKPTISKYSALDLMSSPAFAYQWFINDTLIPNATKQIYKIQKIGTYKVKITDTNGCTIFSDAFPMTTDVPEIDGLTNQISVFPNPSNGLFTITINSTAGESVNFIVSNLIGERLLETNEIMNSSTGEYQISLSNYPPGIYFLKANINTQVYNIKLIKE